MLEYTFSWTLPIPNQSTAHFPIQQSYLPPNFSNPPPPIMPPLHYPPPLSNNQFGAMRFNHQAYFGYPPHPTMYQKNRSNAFFSPTNTVFCMFPPNCGGPPFVPT
jgi:hypothetical protein